MNCIARMRRSAFLLLVGAGVLLPGGLTLAQSPALPATLPSKAQPATPASVPAAVPAAPRVPAQPVTHRAQVVFSGGQLSIAADNSSLNQILRDVSRQTGMKITGGVADQRVFGKYGPGAPSGILANLLDGTGSNMLLRESATHMPLELVLTPRGGGLTPPSPNATGGDDDAAASREGPAQQSAAPNPQSQTPPQPPAPQTAPSSGFFGAPGAVSATVPATGVGSGPGTAAQSANGSNPQSPNGVLTPQQILQQLQQLQSQPSTK